MIEVLTKIQPSKQRIASQEYYGPQIRNGQVFWEYTDHVQPTVVNLTVLREMRGQLAIWYDASCFK